MDWKERGGCALLQLPASAPPSWTAAPSSGHWVGRERGERTRQGGGMPPTRENPTALAIAADDKEAQKTRGRGGQSKLLLDLFHIELGPQSQK